MNNNSILLENGLEKIFQKNQIHRENVLTDCPESYFKVIICIRYLDSLLLSLKERVSEKNEIPYSLFQLLPQHINKLDKHQY